MVDLTKCGKALTFDDVVIRPQFSNIASRNDIDMSTTLGKIRLGLPVVSSNMEIGRAHV